MTDFRPYYAFVRFSRDENGKIQTEVEKCYTDDPESWSPEAKAEIKEFLSDGGETGSTSVKRRE